MQSLFEERRSGASALAPASEFEDIEADLTELIFRGVIPTIIVSILGVVAAAGLVAYRFHDRYLWTLAATSLAVCSIRLSIALAYRALSAATLPTRAAVRWRKRYNGITILYYATLCATVLYECHAFGTTGTSLCTLGVFCVCIGLSSRIGMRPHTMQVCGVMLLGSLAFSIWRNTPSLYGVSLLMIAFFTYQFCSSSRTQFNVVVEQLRSRQRMRLLSEQDALTGLANRRHFEQSLAHLCADRRVFAILYIDLDRFKHVNDTFGHATGDTLLIQVSQRLSCAIRSTDLLARLGGDEFAILQTPLADPESAQALAQRVNHDIADPFHIAEHTISIGASVGVRLSTAGDGNPDTLLSKADHALYTVKRRGGGSFALAEA